MDISREYSRIMTNESILTNKKWTILEPSIIASVTKQISEVAEAGLILRIYNRSYGLTMAKSAFESTSAHSNLMGFLLDKALSLQYGPNFQQTNDGFTHQELTEAVRRHDLPENCFGDIPDDGSRDEHQKRFNENIFHDMFSRYYPAFETAFEANVSKLLVSMENKDSTSGRLLYAADKSAAIIMTLQYDKNGMPPILRKNIFKKISERNRFEMAHCDKKVRGGYRASEMWAVDWLKGRKLSQYDDTGFFTAIIIMRTLQVNGCWYTWRERDYT